MIEATKLKALHDAEIIQYGERGMERPRSRGTTYDDGKADPKLATDQTARDQCDINFIMKKYEKTGQLTELIAQGQALIESGQFAGDYSASTDLQQALQITAHAKEQFALLNAPVRNRFDNDPVKFLQFMEDPNNLEEQHKLGLRSKNKVEAAPEVPPTTPPAAQETPKPASEGGGQRGKKQTEQKAE